MRIPVYLGMWNDKTEKMRKVKVGDFLHRTKNLISIKDSDEYKLVTIKMYHKGIQLRRVIKGNEIQADKMSKVKAGQFILSGIDARHGAFGIIPKDLDGAIVTNDFWHFEIDNTIISEEYFLWLTSTPFFDDICKKASDGTTNRVRLQADRFYSQELIIPDIQDQHKVVEELKNKSNEIKHLQTELAHQLTLIENLNQAILQEAVQGKLVPQDPKDEPASKLLERIKAEKAKTGKKDKPLPPIKPEEIPFEIPKNWVWCRLGEITNIQRGSSPRPKGDPVYFSKVKTQFNWITISDISNFSKNNILLQTEEYLTEEGTKQSRYVDVNEFIIAVSGSTTGKCCITGIEGFIYDGLAVAKIIDNGIESKFLLNYMMCLYSIINNSKTGASFPNINTDYLNNLIFPLPPLSEQQRIVAEIEKQLSKTKELKAHIIANQQATEQLLKALLHGAFEVEENK